MTTVQFDTAEEMLSDVAVLPIAEEAYENPSWGGDRREAHRAEGVRPRFPLWFVEIVDVLGAYLSLKPDWDSYGGTRIDPQAALEAARLLLTLAAPDTPKPSIFPTPHGGVQIEWHLSHMELEIDVRSPARLEVGYEIYESGEEEEFEITSDFRPLVALVQRLSEIYP
jgi:hypothetical protein